MEKLMRTLSLTIIAALAAMVLMVVIQTARIVQTPNQRAYDPVMEKQILRMTSGAALLDSRKAIG